MNEGTNPIEVDADVRRASYATLSDEQLRKPMLATPFENGHGTLDDDADVVMKITNINVRGLIAQGGDPMYA